MVLGHISEAYLWASRKQASNAVSIIEGLLMKQTKKKLGESADGAIIDE